MKKLYDENEMRFSLILIVLYVVLFSTADRISASIGTNKSVTVPLGILMTCVLFYFIRKNGLSEKYGLCRFKGTAKHYLYFIPLVALASTNLWWGAELKFSILETVLYVISMICVGFIEEIIFRGFLFNAMCKSNVKRAIIVSSITFGLGHIVNLVNGAELVSTLMQICYAVACGFLFTILFYKGKSLWPCIITHATINSLSAFAVESKRNAVADLIASVFLCIVSFSYAAYILRKESKLTE